MDEEQKQEEVITDQNEQLNDEELHQAIEELITVIEEKQKNDLEYQETLTEKFDILAENQIMLNESVVDNSLAPEDITHETIDYTEQLTFINENLEEISLSTDSVIAYTYVFIPLLVVVLLSYWFFKQFMERYI